MPHVWAKFLKSKGSEMTARELWARWRSRQRIEQYQDNQFYTGHHGYLDCSRRALIYILRSSKLPFGLGGHPNPASRRHLKTGQ